jgi:hypothetical protein
LEQIFTPADGFQPNAIGSFICHKTPFLSKTIHPEDGGRVPLLRELAFAIFAPAVAVAGALWAT